MAPTPPEGGAASRAVIEPRADPPQPRSRGGGVGTEVVGRADEQERLGQLLVEAARGRSGVLIVQGEAGIGKTTLLQEAVGSARGFRALAIAGTEAEVAIGFAALHRLLSPLLPETTRLPRPQRDAIEAAFGLRDAVPDRFLLSLATLSLLASEATDRPLLCLIDDAQWIDRESLEVLSFVGRRLFAEGIVLLFGMRVGVDGGPPPPEGLPVVHLGGLPPDAARELLHASVPGRIDERVAQRLIEDSHGSPLALVEMAGQLTHDQLVGRASLGDVLSIGSRLEAHFLAQVRTLPPEAQLLLLVAACDSTGDPALIWRAGAVMGFGFAEGEAAKSSRLLSLSPSVEFRHPLVRSAVHGGAPPAQLRRVHEVLADATDPDSEPDRRAWHRAAATAAPSEEVATELLRCADVARRRGGYAAEAAFRSRAAELSPDPARRVARLLEAARAHLTAGEPRKVKALLETVEPMLDGPAERAEAQWLRAGLRALSSPGDVPALLLESATALAPLDPAAARERSGEALNALTVSYQLSHHVTPADVAREARRIRGPADGQASPVDLLIDGFARRIADGYVAAHPFLHRMAQQSAADAPSVALHRWIGLVNCLVRELWDDTLAPSLLRRVETAQRAVGALDMLPVTLEGLAHYELWRGRFGHADALYSEATSLAVALGNSERTWDLLTIELHAWRGDAARVHAMAEVLTSEGFRRSGAGTPFNTAHMALAILAIGEGDYREALAPARYVFDVDPLSQGHQAIPELIEAAVRCDEAGTAGTALTRLTERATTAATPWALGVLARCRALTGAGPVEAHYSEAITLLEQCDMAVDLARAHLLFGEWLRDQQRRADAREHLATAADMFSRFGASSFERRARSGLAGVGGGGQPKPRPGTRRALTPQEAQIAHLAATGATNSEISAQVFLSAATVDYHLRKVFRTLGIRSRRQLAEGLRGLAGDEP